MDFSNLEFISGFSKTELKLTDFFKTLPKLKISIVQCILTINYYNLSLVSIIIHQLS